MRGHHQRGIDVVRSSTTTRASSNAAGTLSDTALDRVASLDVAAGALSASAGRDVNLVSARLIASGDITLAATPITAGANAAENNWLSQRRPTVVSLTEQQRYENAASDCATTGDATACATRDQLAQTTTANDAALRTACASGATNSAACAVEIRRAQAAGNSVYVDGSGNITVNGVPFATVGPVSSPFTTSTAGQMAQSTADGLPALLGSYGAGVLGDMAATAQTTLLPGIGSIGASRWIVTGAIGAGFSIGSTYFFDPDASISTYIVNGMAGAVGGTVKLGANAAAGLANQWIPTNVGNLTTQLLGTSVGRIISTEGGK